MQRQPSRNPTAAQRGVTLTGTDEQPHNVKRLRRTDGPACSIELPRSTSAPNTSWQTLHIVGLAQEDMV